MTTPLPPAEVAAHLDRLSFGERRALKKAGYRLKGLRKLADTAYGASLAESVLACHTGVLGRPAEALDTSRAQTALNSPGVKRTKFSDVPAPAHVTVSQRSKDMRAMDESARAGLEELKQQNDTGRAGEQK
jgi:hypothetical protein